MDLCRVASPAAMPILLASVCALWAAFAWRHRKAIRAWGRRVLSRRRRTHLLLWAGALLACAVSFRARTPSYMGQGADILNYMAYARYAAFHYPVVRANLWTDLAPHSLPVDTQAGLFSAVVGMLYYVGLANVWCVTLVCVAASVLMLGIVRALLPARFGAIRLLVAFACLFYATFALAPGPGHDRKFHLIVLFLWLAARTPSRPRLWDYFMVFLAGAASIWMHAAVALTLLAAFGCWQAGRMIAQKSLRPALEIICIGMGAALGFALIGSGDLVSRADQYSSFCAKYGLGFGMMGKPTTDSFAQAARIAWSKIVAAHASLALWRGRFGNEALSLAGVVLACAVMWAHSRRPPRPAIWAPLLCWAYLAAMGWFVYPLLVAIMPTEKRHLLTAAHWSLIHLGRWLSAFLAAAAGFALCWGAWGLWGRLRPGRGGVCGRRPRLLSAFAHIGTGAALAALAWQGWGPMVIDTLVRINWHRRHQHYAAFRELGKLDEVCPPGSAVLCHPYYAYNVMLAARRVFPIAVDAMHTPYTALYFLDPGKRLDDLAALFTTSDPSVAHRILGDYRTRYVLMDDQTSTGRVDFLRFMGGVDAVASSAREGWTLLRFPERPMASPYRVRHLSPRALATGDLREALPALGADRNGDLSFLTGLNQDDYRGFTSGSALEFPIPQEGEPAFVGIRYINYGADGEFTLRLVPVDAAQSSPEAKVAYGPSHSVFYPAYSRATWELPKTARGVRYGKLVIESRQPKDVPAVVDQIVLVERTASSGEGGSE